MQAGEVFEKQTDPNVKITLLWNQFNILLTDAYSLASEVLRNMGGALALIESNDKSIRHLVEVGSSREAHIRQLEQDNKKLRIDLDHLRDYVAHMDERLKFLETRPPGGGGSPPAAQRLRR